MQLLDAIRPYALHTSYFANIRRLVKQPEHVNTLYVSIARYNPQWAGEMLNCKLLAPSAFLLASMRADMISQQDYTDLYNEEISDEDVQLSFEKMLSAIARLSVHQGKLTQRIVMLCYEKPTEFCHRHVLAQLLKQRYNLNVTEL